MNNIAFFSPNANITYTAILLVLGILTALTVSLLIAAGSRKPLLPVLVCAAIGVVTAPVCARLVYAYSRYEQFADGASPLSLPEKGGYSLLGAFVGVMLAVLIVRLLRLTDSLFSLLDSLAPGAAIGIAIGRLAGFFTGDDKGNFVYTDPSRFKLPWAVCVTDQSTGAQSWRFATFLWEAIAGAAIFAVLAALLFLRVTRRVRLDDGALFLVFISLFGATQAVLESTRYDSLHMRSNGFLSLMQFFALLMLLVPPVLYSVRLRRRTRSLKPVALCWALVLFSVATAGYLEYYIQRHASEAMRYYPVMLAALLITAVAPHWIYHLGKAGDRRREERVKW